MVRASRSTFSRVNLCGPYTAGSTKHSRVTSESITKMWPVFFSRGRCPLDPFDPFGPLDPFASGVAQVGYMWVDWAVQVGEVSGSSGSSGWFKLVLWLEWGSGASVVKRNTL